MIVLDCEQGSDEWIQARLGIPTATGFGSILTSKGELSAGRRKYRAQLVTEWVKKEQYAPVETDEMYRGKELESAAFEAYSLITDIMPVKVGFCFRDEKRMVGCSPDGLVAEEGLLELKCPSLDTHIGYLETDEFPMTYFAQTQGQIWVTGRKWVDFMSFYPSYPHFLVRMLPDERYQRRYETGISV